jgi:DNA repair ATPase RecN
MTRIFKNVVVPCLFFTVFVTIVLPSMSVHSASRDQLAKCDEIKKDLTEMKEDLDAYNNKYKKGGAIDSEDKNDLITDISDFRDDFNKYLKDLQSDPMEITKAEEGLRLVTQMEDGIKNNISMVLSSYKKIFELYEWFYQHEDCK